ncbi:hypothetical protein [Streptomyces naphthomycinicus]|uniref:hypothetical protein n=1 Tax=Streptomyces naphthomycinicus TaxID=2872625 RepID=UPI001CED476C|nr:hypothetical protein [Streptomyces sp. TML10]
MHQRRPYPRVQSGEDLQNLAPVRIVEVAGSGRQISLADGEDPYDAAERFMSAHPWDTRFRYLTVQRFELPPRPGWDLHAWASHVTCQAVDTLESGQAVRCSLVPHSDGVDHATRLLRDGQVVGVHYWSTKSP